MIELVVLGVPAPQGSKSAVVRGGRAVLIEGASTAGREKHRAWREAVAWQARTAAQHGPVFEDVPVTIKAVFVLPKPKSRPNKTRWADRKPDLDKVIRATLDGLSDGGLIGNDSRVVRVEAEKRYQEPGQATGAVITVGEVPAMAHSFGVNGLRQRLGGTDV